MATLAISCPKCESQIKVPPELEGKKIRCKECSYVFVVKAPPGAKAAAKADKPDKKEVKEKQVAANVEDEDDDDGKAYGVTDQSLLPHCAFCAKEMDSEDQVVCLHCGYNHRTRERIQTEKTLAPTGGQWFFHLLPGIICAFFMLLFLSDIPLTWINREEHYTAYGEDALFNPYGLGLSIWRTVIGLFIAFFLGRYAVKRLILNPKPRERQMAKRKK